MGEENASIAKVNWSVYFCLDVFVIPLRHLYRLNIDGLLLEGCWAFMYKKAQRPL